MLQAQLLLLAAALVEAAPAYKPKIADVTKIGTQESIFPFLAGSAPHFSYPVSFGIPKEVPEKCTMKQVQVFARHGERFPTSGTGDAITSTYYKFSNYTSSFNGSLTFLNDDYEFFLFDRDDLEEETSWENTLDPINPYTGEQDSQRHAREFLYQYSELLENTTSFPIFAANRKRVYDTAKYFADALGVKYNVSMQVIDEGTDVGANTLTPSFSCSAFNWSEHKDVYGNFSNQYLKDISGRLNKQNKGLELNTTDAANLFDWCAFEINAKGYSDICDVFTQEELVKWSYYNDMHTYYRDGPGNSLAPTMGAVNFNASIELLKQSDQLDLKVWLSFTHDVNLVNYLTAVGLFDDGKKLTPDNMPFQSQLFHGSWQVPQGARIYTQLYQCGDQSYVRYVVNDVVIPIPSCASGPGFSCELDEFVEYGYNRTSGTDYVASCDTTKSSNETELTFYWDYTTKNYNASLIIE
ncbi:LANO_0D11078g1_1 [Lachancea nothofagi CBS 11611]|uniref:acid phosphatase n=1 Tax=Lachancea nothofagi CBS 11611 TaxID=1266666 RepID=A0A1G4JL14_9SACH|nr:LANO_0D11078g1_1 [Lachancea nothofagi CBS 11611]